MGCVAEDGWLAKEDTNRGRKKKEKKGSLEKKEQRLPRGGRESDILRRGFFRKRKNSKLQREKWCCGVVKNITWILVRFHLLTSHFIPR